MDVQTAMRLLGLEAGSPAQAIDAAFEARRTSLEERIRAAPTYALRAKARLALDELTEAHAVAAAAAPRTQATSPADPPESSVPPAPQPPVKPPTAKAAPQKPPQPTELARQPGDMDDASAVDLPARPPRKQPDAAPPQRKTAPAQPADEDEAPFAPTAAHEPAGTVDTNATRMYFSPQQVLADRYEIRGRVSDDGISQLYVAYDTHRLSEVAVRTYPSFLIADPTDRTVVLNELRAAANLVHPNVANIFDVHAVADPLWIVMALPPSRTLADAIEQRPNQNPFSVDEVVKVGRQVCGALAYAHHTGIVHAHLRPQCVWFSPNGAVRVADFGMGMLRKLARRRGAAASIDNDAYYMSPQITSGERADARSDQYALAAMLYDMLVGKLPDPHSPPRHNIRMIRRDAPKALAQALERALAGRSEDRFPDIESFDAALARSAGRLSIGRIAAAIAIVAVLIGVGVTAPKWFQPIKGWTASLFGGGAGEPPSSAGDDPNGDQPPGASSSAAKGAGPTATNSQISAARTRMNDAAAKWRAFEQPSNAPAPEAAAEAQHAADEGEHHARAGRSAEAVAAFDRAAALYQDALTQAQAMGQGRQTAEAARQAMAQAAERCRQFRSDSPIELEYVPKFVEAESAAERAAGYLRDGQYDDAARSFTTAAQAYRAALVAYEDQHKAGAARLLDELTKTVKQIEADRAAIAAQVSELSAEPATAPLNQPSLESLNEAISQAASLIRDNQYVAAIGNLQQARSASATLVSTTQTLKAQLDEAAQALQSAVAAKTAADEARAVSEAPEPYRAANQQLGQSRSALVRYGFSQAARLAKEASSGFEAALSEAADRRAARQAKEAYERAVASADDQMMHQHAATAWLDVAATAARGETAMQAGDWKTATLQFDQARQILPDVFEFASLACARALVEQSQYKSAVDVLDRLLEVMPGHAEARAMRERISDQFEYVNSLGMRFVRIPAGTYTRGSPADEPQRRVDEAAHEVTLTRPIMMGAAEVTLGQFRQFVEADPGRNTPQSQKLGRAFGVDKRMIRELNGVTWKSPGFEQSDNHPVVCVTWAEAVAFCQWLSRKEGRTYRLPTDAEWEYACRAGTATAYAWGDDANAGRGWCNAKDRTLLDKVNMFNQNISSFFDFEDTHVYTAPVGATRPNAWGLYDMHGNVAEWCADWYADNPTVAQKDPQGPAEGQYRVIRGGGWFSSPGDCRSAARSSDVPDRAATYIGFRVVLEIAGQ